MNTTAFIAGLLLGVFCLSGDVFAGQELGQPQHLAAADSLQQAASDVPPGLILVHNRMNQIRLEQQARVMHLPVAGLHPRATYVVVMPTHGFATPALPAAFAETTSEGSVVGGQGAWQPADEAGQAARIQELEQQIMRLESLLNTGISEVSETRSTPAIPVSTNLQIPFEANSDRLPVTSFAELREIGQWLLLHPQLQLEIIGHTDDSGARALNMSLSEARARAVRSFLLTSFPELAPERLTARGLGPDQPVADNATPEGRAQNRRVTFTLIDQ